MKSDVSVTKYPKVAICVFIILFNLSTAGCQGLAPIGAVAANFEVVVAVQEEQPASRSFPETEAEREERMNHPLVLAPERMSIRAVPSQVPLGNPLDLTLQIAPGKLVGNVSVIQSSKSLQLEQGSGPAKLVAVDGQTLTIEVTPAQIGAVTMRIGVVYSDNAITEQEVQLNVVPTAKGLKHFFLYGGGDTMGLKLDGEDFEQERRLTPTAEYEGLKYPIYLSDCSQLSLSVEPVDGQLVINVGNDCVVHALREGRAVITGTFDGVTDRIIVSVATKGDSPSM